jgi:hypothetical protein
MKRAGFIYVEGQAVSRGREPQFLAELAEEWLDIGHYAERLKRAAIT